MKGILQISIILIVSMSSFAQSRILVYHETNQFRHESINAGISMFEDLGNENGDWITDNSQDSSVFTASNLAQYDAVVFLNTSGSDETGGDGDLLSASEKIALENFIASGKGFVGVHAATDTYRDGVWPFYNELVGAIVQTSPNHTANNFNADMEVITSHPIIDFLGPLGSIWNKDEEYYYWQINGGQLSTDNTVLLEVEQTGSNPYDAARPITWYKEAITYDDDGDGATPEVTLSGIRSFYTALGHNSSDYNNNTNFRTMLKNATLWAIGDALSVTEQSMGRLKVYPNPMEDYIIISMPNYTSPSAKVSVFNGTGQIILTTQIDGLHSSGNNYRLEMGNLKSGVYLLELKSDDETEQIKFVKK
ncbi:ThuA domain-containing protein [Winogradskyella aurantia]|uniref:ThuA-like domain-containing protein n=1 Tax=Winogradskyella aurantia TaxID=1915063 RepID=A0A265UQF6_9FLAO|nr:ThuA domain-containing protein [Winogradskyella aurantia]OZV67540.1 hypothetical protein CA834_11350 [Winogradskyella aurantia]